MLGQVVVVSSEMGFFAATSVSNTGWRNRSRSGAVSLESRPDRRNVKPSSATRRGELPNWVLGRKGLAEKSGFPVNRKDAESQLQGKGQSSSVPRLFGGQTFYVEGV
jgi:hypothetical protein